MPATLILIAANVLTWLVLIFGGERVAFLHLLGFSTGAFPLALWSVLTWPFLGAGDPISLLFGCAWAYMIGGSLERSWGTRTVVMFFLATNTFMAFCVWGGAMLLHTPAYLNGLWESLAPLTVAWCLLNKRETVRLYFMPVPAMFIAYLSMLLLWWRVGPPFLGFFALLSCAAAWWYAENGRYSSRGYTTTSSPFAGGFRSPFNGGGSSEQGRSSRTINAPRESLGSDNQGFNPLRWWRRRQENKKLEAMFRRSGYTDDENKKR